LLLGFAQLHMLDGMHFVDLIASHGVVGF